MNEIKEVIKNDYLEEWINQNNEASNGWFCGYKKYDTYYELEIINEEGESWVKYLSINRNEEVVVTLEKKYWEKDDECEMNEIEHLWFEFVWKVYEALRFENENLRGLHLEIPMKISKNITSNGDVNLSPYLNMIQLDKNEKSVDVCLSDVRYYARHVTADIQRASIYRT